MLIRETHRLSPVPAAYGTRSLAIALLRAASRALDALAIRLVPEARTAAGPGVVEYHAEAGAPEGALYIDGRLIGHVTGVQRL